MPSFLVLLFSLLSASVFAAPLNVFYTANRQGEVDPCGCPDGVQNGGIDRMAAALNVAGNAPRFFADAGDTFFSVTAILPTRHELELRHAHLIARAYRLMGVDAMTPGERDLAEGLATLRELEKESGMKLVSANLTGADGQLLFPASVVVDKGGAKVGVIGISEPSTLAPSAPAKAKAIHPAIDEEVKKLRAAGAKPVIVLSHLGLDGDRELAKSTPGIDLIIGSHSLDALGKAEVVGDTRIVQPIYQGQQLGELVYDGDGVWKGDRLIDLGKTWNKPNAVHTLLNADKEEMRKGALSSEPPTKAVKADFVAQPFACAKCHAKQVSFWEKTKHASAYLVLYAKNQHFDPECVNCHVLPGSKSIVAPIERMKEPKRKKGETPFIEKILEHVFAKDGKRRDLDSRREPERFTGLQKRYLAKIHSLVDKKQIRHLYAGVQCEHCHGAMAGHPAKNPHPGKVAEKTCRGCHDKERSPEFQWAWRALVACPH